jgi:hypothetical protein
VGGSAVDPDREQDPAGSETFIWIRNFLLDQDIEPEKIIPDPGSYGSEKKLK